MAVQLFSHTTIKHYGSAQIAIASQWRLFEKPGHESQCGSFLRRLLRSAERFSERAMSEGARLVKTPDSRSNALLIRVTRWVQVSRLVAGISVV